MESHVELAKENLQHILDAGWQQPMKDQERRIEEDTKMKQPQKDALMEHARRIERMEFWKALHESQIADAQYRIEYAEYNLERWQQQPRVFILKERALKKKSKKETLDQDRLF